MIWTNTKLSNSTQARHLLVNLAKELGFHEKLDLLAPYGNWGGFDKTEMCGKWCATLWARVSNFLSHRIVKSLSSMIFGKLGFQCTRNGSQNPPFCPGSPQNTFIFLRYFKTKFVQIHSPEIEHLESWQYDNLKYRETHFPKSTDKCPANSQLADLREPQENHENYRLGTC